MPLVQKGSVLIARNSASALLSVDVSSAGFTIIVYTMRVPVLALAEEGDEVVDKAETRILLGDDAPDLTRVGHVAVRFTEREADPKNIPGDRGSILVESLTFEPLEPMLHTKVESSGG